MRHIVGLIVFPLFLSRFHSARSFFCSLLLFTLVRVAVVYVLFTLVRVAAVLRVDAVLFSSSI